MGTPGYKENQEPDVLKDPVLASIAAKHGVTVAQVCLAWALQRGTTVVSKSASAQHQAENWQVLGPNESTDPSSRIQLSSDEMIRIAELDRNYRFFRPDDWWPHMSMAVFD